MLAWKEGPCIICCSKSTYHVCYLCVSFTICIPTKSLNIFTRRSTGAADKKLGWDLQWWGRWKSAAKFYSQNIPRCMLPELVPALAWTADKLYLYLGSFFTAQHLFLRSRVRGSQLSNWLCKQFNCHWHVWNVGIWIFVLVTQVRSS